MGRARVRRPGLLRTDLGASGHVARLARVRVYDSDRRARGPALAASRDGAEGGREATSRRRCRCRGEARRRPRPASPGGCQTGSGTAEPRCPKTTSRAASYSHLTGGDRDDLGRLSTHVALPPAASLTSRPSGGRTFLSGGQTLRVPPVIGPTSPRPGDGRTGKARVAGPDVLSLCE